MICKRKTSVYEQVANKQCSSENSIRIYIINTKLFITNIFGDAFQIVSRCPSPVSELGYIYSKNMTLE